MLNSLYDALKKENQLKPIVNALQNIFPKDELMKSLNISSDVYVISVYNLMRMQLLSPGIIKGGVKMGPEPLTIYKGIDAVCLSPLGIKFVEACIK
jgi:hypothetical protein